MARGKAVGGDGEFLRPTSRNGTQDFPPPELRGLQVASPSARPSEYLRGVPPARALKQEVGDDEHMATQSDIRQFWARIEHALQRWVPRTAQTLAPPATYREIEMLETTIELKLPDQFRESLKIHNGQNDPSGCHSFIIEGLLANTTQIAETWRMLNDVDEHWRKREPDWDMHSSHEEWWDRRWVPFTTGQGDCLCINLNPDVRPGGTFGEIVCHLNSNPHEPGIARSYGAWIEALANKLDEHDFTINEYGYLSPNIH
jgi:cell wall assembly regulator SMI1